MPVRVAVNLDLFAVMARPESHPRTAVNLASLVNADQVVLGKQSPQIWGVGILLTLLSVGRILKQMAAMDFIREIGPGEYELNAVSQAMLDPAYRDGFPFW